MKRGILWTTILLGIVLIVAFIVINNYGEEQTISVNKSQQGNGQQESIWRTTELIDVSSGESFRIEDFEGKKPVLLESFAVWCPFCTAQQQEIKKLHDKIGEDFVSISLDTDPNEDADKVRGHLETYGFDWRYAISPIESTQSLIKDFGISIVNAPSAPVVLICENGEAHKLKSGIKDAEFLEQEINNKCSQQN